MMRCRTMPPPKVPEPLQWPLPMLLDQLERYRQTLVREVAAYLNETGNVTSVNGQTGDVSLHVPSKVSELENDSGYLTRHQDISGKQDAIPDLDAIRAGAAKGMTAVQDVSGKADKATTLAGYGITDAKIESGTVTLGGSSITPLTAHQDISGKADKSDTYTKAQTDSAISFAISAVKDSAPEAFDTLKEIADWIGDDQSGAAAMAASIGNKVDKVPGKGLSANDYTTAEKDKLAGVESGAKDNIVEAASLSAFPATGDAGKIYVAKDTNLTYRWGANSYVQIGGDTSGKADKVANAAAGDFAGLDASGNLTDIPNDAFAGRVGSAIANAATSWTVTADPPLPSGWRTELNYENGSTEGALGAGWYLALYNGSAVVGEGLFQGNSSSSSITWSTSGAGYAHLTIADGYEYTGSITVTRPAVPLLVNTDDRRLGDARTPTPHAGTHAAGGDDPLSPGDIGAATAAQGAKADSAYQKPQAGIPATDMAQAVQASLGKADTALQSHQGLSDRALAENPANLWDPAVDGVSEDETTRMGCWHWAASASSPYAVSASQAVMTWNTRNARWYKAASTGGVPKRAALSYSGGTYTLEYGVGSSLETHAIAADADATRLDFGRAADGRSLVFVRFKSSAAVTHVVYDDSEGYVGEEQLKADAVTTAKIADVNVTTAKIADGAVTTAKIADANVTTAKIADANVTEGKLAANAVTTAKIADANVTTAKIADANVTEGKLAANAVTTAKIADGAVTGEKLQSGMLGYSLETVYAHPVYSARLPDGFYVYDSPTSTTPLTDIAVERTNYGGSGYDYFHLLVNGYHSINAYWSDRGEPGALDGSGSYDPANPSFFQEVWFRYGEGADHGGGTIYEVEDERDQTYIVRAPSLVLEPVGMECDLRDRAVNVVRNEDMSGSGVSGVLDLALPAKVGGRARDFLVLLHVDSGDSAVFALPRAGGLNEPVVEYVCPDQDGVEIPQGPSETLLYFTELSSGYGDTEMLVRSLPLRSLGTVDNV